MTAVCQALNKASSALTRDILSTATLGCSQSGNKRVDGNAEINYMHYFIIKNIMSASATQGGHNNSHK